MEGLGRVRERVGHPVVHAEVEVRHDEDRRLELLGEVEGLLGHREALLGRGGEEERVLRVAVRVEVAEEDVALHRARREAGGRPGALDVEDDGRDLGVVAEADVLGHERDAGSRTWR